MVLKIDYKEVKANFDNHYIDLKIEINDMLSITILFYSNHIHDKETGKSMTILIIFVGYTSIYWCSKRHDTAQKLIFGADLIALQRALEEAVKTRY